MRRYICGLKLFECSNIVRFALSDTRDIPEEVLRMMRVKYGLAYVLGEESIFFWKVGVNVRTILRGLEEFSGRHRVGKDDIGYYWETH